MSLIQQVTQPRHKSYRIPICSGERFEKLTAVEFALWPGRKGKKRWLCRCDCGNEIYADAHALLVGRAKSCGCFVADKMKARRSVAVEPAPIPGARFIPLTRGLFAIVSEEDFERLSKMAWYAWWDKEYDIFYAVRHARHEDGRRYTVFMHREIVNTPQGMLTDHIHPDRTLDNRRSNLRIVTIQQSNLNKRMQRGNTCGFKGVWQDKGKKKWRARIKLNGKRYNLGGFNTKEMAYAAYCVAAKRLHGEFAQLDCRSPGLKPTPVPSSRHARRHTRSVLQ